MRSRALLAGLALVAVRPPVTRGHVEAGLVSVAGLFAPLDAPRTVIVLSLALVVSSFVVLLRMRNAAAARAAASEAVAAQRARALDSQRTFLADAGHEIKTPLTVLRGDIEVALLRARTQEQYEAVLRRAHGDLLNVSALADDLITLARSDSGELPLSLAPVDLASFLSELCDAFRSAAEVAGSALELDVASGLFVRADHLLLRRAVANLLDNAVKHGGGGGIIRVAAAAGADGRVEVRVTDRGPGIAEADRPRVFERFYRGAPKDGQRPGSGLGLSIAKAVMELHGGGIEALAPGAGAALVLWLPAADERRR